MTQQSTKPRMYLSGRFSTSAKLEKAWLKRTGCKYRCFSFASVYPKCLNYSDAAVDALRVCEEKDIGIMMDSGAFSLHRLVRKGKVAPDKIEVLRGKMYKWYKKFCLQNASKWDFYVTLDYKVHQPTIYAMQQQFKADGLAPAPVYHGDSDLSWLLKQKELFNNNFICIGRGISVRGPGYKGQRFYLDRIFNFGAKHNLHFHGLAMTSLSLITAYPWFSVDSSTWVQSSIYGMIVFPDREKNTIWNLHISEKQTTTAVASYNRMPRKQQQMVCTTIKDFGFTLDELRDAKDGLEGRHVWNGKMFANIFDLVDTTKQKHVNWESLF